MGGYLRGPAPTERGDYSNRSRGARAKHLFMWTGGWHNRLYNDLDRVTRLVIHPRPVVSSRRLITRVRSFT